MNKFEKAKFAIAQIISHSKTEEDPTHSINAHHWLLQLNPKSDEILQLAILAHDIERATPDRLTKDQFANYNQYKLAHATKGGHIAAQIALESGYNKEESERLANIIKLAEFESPDPDISLVCDADSISYFDNNVGFYLRRSGPVATQKKIKFMYSRASKRAKVEIDKILQTKPDIKQLLT